LSFLLSFPTRRSSDLVACTELTLARVDAHRDGLVDLGHAPHLVVLNLFTTFRQRSRACVDSENGPTTALASMSPASISSSTVGRSEEHTSELQSRENL